MVAVLRPKIAGGARPLDRRVTRGWLGTIVLAGCAAQAPVRAPEPMVAPRVASPVAAAPELPRLPEVAAPLRPLANFGVLAHRFAPGDAWWVAGPEFGSLTAERDAVTDVPRWLRGFEPMRRLGEDVLMRRETEAYDEVVRVAARGFGERWRVRLIGHRRMTVTSRMLVVEDRTYQRLTIAGHSLADGREVWRIRVGSGAGPAYTYETASTDERLFVWDGAQLQAFDVTSGVRRWSAPADLRLVVDLWWDDERLYVWAFDGLVAYDAATGAQAWGMVPVDRDCGVIPGPHVIVVEEERGYRVLDPASGAVLRTIPAAGLCLLRQWNEVYRPGATDGRRLVTLEPRVPGYRGKDNPTSLRAYDLETATELWSRELLDAHGPVLDRDAVYVIRGLDTVLALDADSGETRAEISLGSDPRAAGHSLTYDLQDTGGAAGPLWRVDSSDSGAWIFGRLAEPRAREAYVIRGRVVPADARARRRIADLPVKVGGVVVQTDAEGRFEARGEGLGVISVANAAAPSFDAEGVRVEFATEQVFLAGQGAYAVEVELATIRLCRRGERAGPGRCAHGPGPISG